MMIIFFAEIFQVAVKIGDINTFGGTTGKERVRVRG
jgi:hypothetical protein